MKKAFLILPLLIACSTYHPSDAEVHQARMGTLDWEYCEVHDECTAVEDVVCNQKAINKKYKKIFYDFYYGKKIKACDLKPNHSSREFTVVECQENKCTGFYSEAVEYKTKQKKNPKD